MTDQMDKWAGDFGKEYTNRNAVSLDDMEDIYTKRFGVSRTEMNEKFLSGISKDIKILEVGCNVGNQLVTLKKAGFTNLTGMEVGTFALEKARSRPDAKGIEFVQGNAFDIPFEDGSFDMVYTSGVLIHISPDDIGKAVSQMCRCSKKYIWGMEYYADEFTEVNYRGHEKLLWKTDYASLFLDSCAGAKLLKKELYKFLDGSGLQDAMYLIEK